VNGATRLGMGLSLEGRKYAGTQGLIDAAARPTQAGNGDIGPQPSKNVAKFPRISHRVSQKGQMMGERGPIPRSKHLKVLSGERQDRVTPKGVKARPRKPRMPSWLSPFAKECLQEVR
jgi:hypothetical protein